MRPALLLGVLLVLPVALALAPAAPAPSPKEVTKPHPLVTKLAEEVKFSGYEADPKETLQELLDNLAEHYDLNFFINEAAFKAEQVEDVRAVPVIEKSIPAMRQVRLGEVLRKVLDRVPVPSGAMYVIRQDGVEVTTANAVRSEFWGPNYQGPYLPLIHATFDRRPLDEALAELAAESGWNVVLDTNGTGEKGRTAVTARLFNVPLDTAVRLLADMAGLKSFAVDNVLYVTTPATAADMEKREKERMGDSQGPRVGSGRFMPPALMAPAGM